MTITGIIASSLLALNPPEIGPAPATPDLVYRGSFSGVDFTIADVDIGEAQPHRWVYVLWSKSKASGTSGIGNGGMVVSFDGGADETMYYMGGTASSQRAFAMAGISAPTGTSATFTVSAGSASSIHLHVYTCSTPIRHHLITSGANPTFTIPVEEHGEIVVAGGVRNSSSALEFGSTDTVYTNIVSNHRGTLGHVPEVEAEGDFTSETVMSSSVAMGVMSFRGFSPEHKAQRAWNSFGTTHTFADCYIGEEGGSDRLVIFCVGWWSGSTSTRNITSVTYNQGAGDVPMTAAIGSASGSRSCGIYYAVIPTGTSATFKVNYTDTTGQSFINIFSKEGLTAVPSSAASTGATSTASVQAGGFGVQTLIKSGSPTPVDTMDFEINNMMTAGNDGYVSSSKNFAATNAAEPCGYSPSGATRVCTAIWDPA